jgi:hypothetical protein
MTTFPADADRGPAPGFPHIEVWYFIILISAGASGTTLSFYGEDGTPLAIAK